MSGNRWLDSLKSATKETGADTTETGGEYSEALLSRGFKRCERPGGSGEAVPTEPTDIRTTRALRGEGERRLLAAGWSPKERGGLVIWANPETGFYFSREIALHNLEVLKNVEG